MTRLAKGAKRGQVMVVCIAWCARWGGVGLSGQGCGVGWE